MARPPLPQRQGYGEEQADLQAIGFPPGFRLFELSEFKGLNTKAQRPAIDDQEMYVCENWMPIGPANLRTMPGKGAAIYTAAAGKTIVWNFQFNIGSTAYSAVFLSDGTGYQVRLSDGAITTMSSVPNLFYNGGDLPHAVQWANNGILIVSTAVANGYWAWDGTVLYGFNQTAPPWLSGMIAPIVLTGSTHSNTTIDAVSPNPISAGVLINMGIFSNTGDIPAGTLITAGTASTLTISQNATASNAGETLTVVWFMPTGVQGNGIETFQGRVWIINGITRSTSAAQNGTTFAAANGGVIANSTDNTLRVKYVGIKESNGYLYLFGDSSCYYITNIQVSGTTTLTTTYQYTPLDEQIGTPWRDTVQPFGRSVVFANPNGVYSIFGSSASKISDALDGLFSAADFVTVRPCMASATLFNIKVALFLFRTTNPQTQLTYNMIALFDGRRWWTATQEIAPVFLGPQEMNSVLSAYATDGLTLFKLFSQSSATLTKTLVSKLWGGQYSFLSYKLVLRLYIEVDTFSTDVPAITFQVDNQNGSLGNPVTMYGSSPITWVNNNGQPVNWVNNSNQVVQWVTVAKIVGEDGAGAGLLLGCTLTSTEKDIILERAAIGYQHKTAFA
jgi:hypothetical protein